MSCGGGSFGGGFFNSPTNKRGTQKPPPPTKAAGGPPRIRRSPGGGGGARASALGWLPKFPSPIGAAQNPRACRDGCDRATLSASGKTKRPETFYKIISRSFGCCSPRNLGNFARKTALDARPIRGALKAFF